MKSSFRLPKKHFVLRYAVVLQILTTVSAALAETSISVVRMTDMQVIGSHNSFKLAMDPPLLKMLQGMSDEVRGMDYAHRSLTEQLSLGLRGLELDLFHDPEGGLYAKPMGLEMVRRLGEVPAPFDSQVMSQPGFKVLHVPDIDFRSSQPTLKGALAELRTWSEANPRHLPIVITLNLTERGAPIPGAAQPLKFDAEALAALDRELRQGLGFDRLIVPDMVRGNHPTLEQAVLTDGWPVLEKVRGKFLWAMDGGGEKRRAYLQGHPSLRGRVLFTTPAPGSDDAAVLIINNPIRDEARIKKLVALGYLVRTRADADTIEARTNDLRRFAAAKRSGAQVISTDYYLPDPRFDNEYQVRFDDGSYHRMQRKLDRTNVK